LRQQNFPQADLVTLLMCAFDCARGAPKASHRSPSVRNSIRPGPISRPRWNRFGNGALVADLSLIHRAFARFYRLTKAKTFVTILAISPCRLGRKTSSKRFTLASGRGIGGTRDADVRGRSHHAESSPACRSVRPHRPFDSRRSQGRSSGRNRTPKEL
jgi:hypothetical protein